MSLLEVRTIKSRLNIHGNAHIKIVTNSLTTRIIFGKERNPALVYTDLATGERTDGTKDKNKFPGYEFVYSEEDKKYHNMFMDTDLGFGGYVYAEPGMYGNVALLDIASMHPSSIVAEELFGPEYTKRFNDILQYNLQYFFIRRNKIGC